MVKKISLTVSVLFIVVMGFGQGIRFEQGTWSEVLAIAKQQNKPIFVDAYTEWCIPCKRMDREVFSVDRAGQYMNTHFIAYKMDMEKGEGVDFAKKYSVNAFPTLVYLDTDGEMIYKTVGYKNVDQLLAASQAALDPANRLEALHQEYESSDKSLVSLLTYSRKLKQADQFQLAKAAVQKRLGKLRQNEKYTDESWQLFSGYINDYDDPLFFEFVKRKEKFEKVASKEEVNAYIHFVLSNGSLIYRNREDNGQSLAEYIQVVENMRKKVDSQYYIARANYFTHLETKDSLLLFTYALEFLDGEFEPDYDDGKMPYFLAFMANRYVDKDDKRQSAALRWTRRSIELDGGDYKNKFILARLLYNAGQPREALTWAEKALDAEKNTNEAGVIKTLFKGDKISEFIDKIKAEIATNPSAVANGK